MTMMDGIFSILASNLFTYMPRIPRPSQKESTAANTSLV